MGDRGTKVSEATRGAVPVGRNARSARLHCNAPPAPRAALKCESPSLGLGAPSGCLQLGRNTSAGCSRARIAPSSRREK